MAASFVSSSTDLVFVNTITTSGVIMMPSTSAQIGRVITFKDSAGTFAQSSITFSTLMSDTFEDGSVRQTYSDTYGAYSFVSDQNKWYLLGGARMNSATVSSLTTQILNVETLSTQQVFVSTINLEDRIIRGNQPLFSKSNVLFFGSNAWGGGRTAVPFVIPVAPSYTYNGILQTTLNPTLVADGSTTWFVVRFQQSASAYTFSVTKPGFLEFVLVGRGGAGNGNTGSTVGGGGGGGGEVVNYTNNPIYLNVGTYTISVPNTVGVVSQFSGPGINFIADFGKVGTPNGYGGVGGDGTGGGFYPTSFSGGGGGGGNFSSRGSNGDGNFGNGGNGGNGITVVNYLNVSQTNSFGGGGGGGGGSVTGGTNFGGAGPNAGGDGGAGGGGVGAGGNGAAGGGSATTREWGGGGGGGGSTTLAAPTSGGAGGAGVCFIRWKQYSTVVT
jgi:hypothetical protein